MRIPARLPQYLAAISISIGALGTGSAIAWTSNICGELRNGDLNGIEMEDNELGWSASLMIVGSIIMGIPIGFLCDLLGRKGAALASAVPLFGGWMMVMLATHVGVVYAGRLITGIGAGAFCVCGPLYTSEICETAIRGRLGSYFQCFLFIGVLWDHVFGYLMPNLLWYNIACASVPVIFATSLMFFPESPVFYMQKGKPEKAQRSLERIRGKDKDYTEDLKAIQAAIDKKKQMASFGVAIRTKAAKKANLICFMLMVYQQGTGIKAVTLFTQELFRAAGSKIPPHACVVILGVVQVITVYFSSWAIERAGRKVLLIISCSGVMVGCGLIGLFFTMKDRKLIEEDSVQSIGWLPIIGVNTFSIGYALGLGPIAWLASAEIFPPEVKSKCSAAAATFNSILAFLVARFYLNVASALGTDTTFYFFSTLAMTGIPFTYFVIPETKGKSFQQIVAELEGTKTETT